MNNNGKIVANSGIGIGTVLFIIFACGKIFNFGPFGSWSWLKIIFIPILVNVCITLVISIILIIVIICINKKFKD